MHACIHSLISLILSRHPLSHILSCVSFPMEGRERGIERERESTIMSCFSSYLLTKAAQRRYQLSLRTSVCSEGANRKDTGFFQNLVGSEHLLNETLNPQGRNQFHISQKISKSIGKDRPTKHRTASASVGSLSLISAAPGITSPVVTNFASQISPNRSSEMCAHLAMLEVELWVRCRTCWRLRER